MTALTEGFWNKAGNRSGSCNLKLGSSHFKGWTAGNN